MNRKQWKSLWRSVRAGHVNNADLIKRYGIIGTMLSKKDRAVQRMGSWVAGKHLLDIVMRNRAIMSKADRRVVLEAIRCV